MANNPPSSLKIGLAPIGFSDWQDLWELLQQAFAYMQGRIDPPSSITRMKPADLANKSKEEDLILAFDSAANHKLIGCAFIARRSDCLYIGKLAIDKAYRGQGIAKAICNFTEDLARQYNYRSLEIETRVELIENQACFQSLGFKKISERSHTGYSHPTTITMRKIMV